MKETFSLIADRLSLEHCLFRIRDCDKSLVAVPFFRINGVLLPTPRSQVTIFNKHEKPFFEIAPCDSEWNGRFTTSSLNGVQKLASTALNPIRWKIWSAIFIWLFLLLDAEQLFHNLLNGVPEVASTEISRNFTKIWEAVFVNYFLFLEADHFCHNLLFWLELAKINRLKCV